MFGSIVTTTPSAVVTVVVVTTIGSPSGSKSFDNTLPVTGVSCSVSAVSALAIGDSLSGTTFGNTSI